MLNVQHLPMLVVVVVVAAQVVVVAHVVVVAGNSYTSYSKGGSGQPAGYSYSNANGSSYYNNGGTSFIYYIIFIKRVILRSKMNAMLVIMMLEALIEILQNRFLCRESTT